MGALDNIQVVDFGHYVAGPVLGMILADQGAEVIKIDPPGGPRLATEANATWNRGKRSITLDLKDDDDRAVAAGLARRADIVIENFRPGVMDRLGLSEAELRAHNRGLVYCAMPGFGREDARSDMPAWEGTVLAAADVFRPPTDFRSMVQQLHRRPTERDGDPVFTAEPMASMYAALLSATGVLAALRIRNQTGQGQRVEVPLFDAIIQAAGIYALARLPFRPTFGPAMNPWDHQYRCGDGRWLHIACAQPTHAAAMAQALGRRDLVERGLTERNLPDAATHHELILLLNEIFAGETAHHWEALLVEHELPGSVCRSAAEWMNHPQAMDGGHVVEIDDPGLGRTRQPGPVVHLSNAEGSAPSPAHAPDADREELVAGLGAPPRPPATDANTLISPIQGPLDGIRVLDLGLALAGPTCGRTLAELGADVIKIDSPRRGGEVYHYDINRGKRTILLDLETDEGHDLFWELVQTADVIVENFRPGVAEDLAIDYELVAKERPELIYVSITAHGETGPWADLPGFDESVQALTGMQVRYGGADQPAMWPYGEVNDYATGQAAAFGVMLAVFERERTGVGQRITADLARTSGLLQSAHLIDHGSKTWDEPSGPDSRGLSPIQRLYPCTDGWIFVGAGDDVDLEPVLGHADEGDGADDDVEVRLAEWCAERSSADAVEHLVKHGLGAQELAWLNSVMSDPIVVRRGLSVVREHGSIGLLRTSGPGPWLSRSKVDAGNAAPSPGADAASILADIGREDDLDRLAESAIIKLPGSAS